MREIESFGRIEFDSSMLKGGLLMTKISKNIKKLRQAKGLTQDALAQSIHVTRQAVSSWENGRTQPDLDMLDTLSTFFSIPVEQLIYGEKFNTKLDNGKSGFPHAATVLFSILGSLLVFAGLLLIFITGWEKLPKAVKLAFALLPMLGGQACALFVHFKKSNSISFREGASTIWAAGVIATVALTSAIAAVYLDTSVFLLIVTLLVIPIFILMRTVAPLAVFYALTACFQGSALDYGTVFHRAFTNENLRLLVPLALTVVLMSIGFAFCHFFARRFDTLRKYAAFWLSLAMVIAFIYLANVAVDASFMCVILACAISLYVLDSFNKSQSFSTKYIALPAVLVILLLLSADMDFYSNPDSPKPLELLISLLPVVLLIACAVASRKSFASDKLKIPEVAAMTAALVAFAIFEYCFSNKINPAESIDYESRRMLRCLTFEIITFILAVITIIHGAKENSLFRINVGFISICAIIFILMLGVDLELYIKGIVLLVLGAGLLLINYKGISKKKKLLEKAERQVTENE